MSCAHAGTIRQLQVAVLGCSRSCPAYYRNPLGDTICMVLDLGAAQR